MKKPKTPKSAKPQSVWQKTNRTNLVRYLPNGKFYARVKVGGKLIIKSLKTDKITIADLRLADFVKRERRKLDNRKSVVNGEMKFRDALREYAERTNQNHGLKPGTKAFRHTRIAALLKSWTNLQDLDVRKITKADCLRWAAHYGKQSMPATYNSTVDTFRQVLEIAKEAELIFDNPADHIPRRKIKQQPPNIPTNVQFWNILDAITQTKVRYSQPSVDLVKFLAFGGFRRGEASWITWEDVDFEKGEILVKGHPETGTKNSSFRCVQMIPQMREFLINLRKQRSEEPLSATVMKVKKCQGALTSACKKAGVKRMTHHALRHFFVSICNEAGIDMLTISRYIGHKDGGALAMRTYAHLRREHSVAMAQKVFVKRPEQANVIPLSQEQAAQDQAAAQDVQAHSRI